MRVWYLAHPIAGDVQYTTEQNLAHVLKIQKLFFDAEIYTTAPYYSWIVQFGGTSDFKNIMQMLDMDCECVVRLGGIILVGHKISRGMSFELEAARANLCTVVDLTKVPDHLLVQTFKEQE